MYLPLKFMEQIEHMITVPVNRSMEDEVNRKSLEFYSRESKYNRAASFINWTREWTAASIGRKIDEVKWEVWKRRYEEYVGVTGYTPEDFYNQSILNLIYTDWSRNKKVFRIEESMCNDFLNMEIPDIVKMAVFLKLPSKCFYVEPSIDIGVNGDAHGFFVTSDYKAGVSQFCVTSIFDRGRIIPTHTVFGTPGVNDSSKFKDDTNVVLDIDGFGDDVAVGLEDGSTVHFNEKKFVKFVVNFLIYLNAVNRDITYTERTKSIYRPIPEGKEPKNRRSEIEEFGVGYNISTTISASKKRVKYIDVEEDALGVGNREKRGYSSNYRSAHWHHYWVNDEDNPGEKKLIVKWISETFVRGNKESNKVTIHKVTK